MSKVLQEKKVQVFTSSTAEKLVMKGGRVVGVSVRAQGGDFIVFADQIIIATGGASWDEERMHKANPELATVDLSEQVIDKNTGMGFVCWRNNPQRTTRRLLFTERPSKNSQRSWIWIPRCWQRPLQPIKKPESPVTIQNLEKMLPGSFPMQKQAATTQHIFDRLPGEPSAE